MYHLRYPDSFALEQISCIHSEVSCDTVNLDLHLTKRPCYYLSTIWKNRKEICQLNWKTLMGDISIYKYYRSKNNEQTYGETIFVAFNIREIGLLKIIFLFPNELLTLGLDLTNLKNAERASFITVLRKGSRIQGWVRWPSRFYWNPHTSWNMDYCENEFSQRYSILWADPISWKQISTDTFFKHLKILFGFYDKIF